MADTKEKEKPHPVEDKSKAGAGKVGTFLEQHKKAIYILAGLFVLIVIYFLVRNPNSSNASTATTPTGSTDTTGTGNGTTPPGGGGTTTTTTTTTGGDNGAGTGGNGGPAGAPGTSTGTGGTSGFSAFQSVVAPARSEAGVTGNLVAAVANQAKTITPQPPSGAAATRATGVSVNNQMRLTGSSPVTGAFGYSQQPANTVGQFGYSVNANAGRSGPAIQPAFGYGVQTKQAAPPTIKVSTVPGVSVNNLRRIAG